MRGYIYIFLTGSLSCVSQVAREPRLATKVFGCDLLYNEPCSSEYIRFIFYNSYDRDGGLVLNVNDPYLGPWFDPLLPTKLLIHGYNEADQTQSNSQKIRKAYLNHGEYNVIYVEWWKLSLTLCYPEAVINAQHVALCVTRLLLAMEATYPEFDHGLIHAVGFSLGAHIASYSSISLRSATGVPFKRITGLDPAKPFITGSRPWKYLDHGDADFVDIVHTNAGQFGRVASTGHVDFYVNGGRNQKYCNDSFDFNSQGCSHGRAAVYFAESITSEVGFWGIRCASLWHALLRQCPTWATRHRAIMGEPCTDESRGIFFVDTKFKPPYAKGYY